MDDGSLNPATAKKNAFDIYDYIFKLEEQVRNLSTERQVISSKTMQMEKEVQRLRKELEELTNPPLVVGVVQDIFDDNTVVIRNTNGIEFLVNATPEHKKAASVGGRVAMTQRGLSIVRILPEVKDPRAKAMEVIEKPTVTFESIGGLKDEIRELEEAVILPMTERHRFEKLGIDPPKGVLLFGEPGTGKTLLAKAVANKTNSTFIGITASELVRKYIGDGAKLVRDVFKIASEKRPAIIFIDEIDAIGSHRFDSQTGGDREVQRTLMQLLSEMDGFKELQGVAIMAATNRIDILDPALLRPGRFDRVIEIPLPDKDGLEAIFKIHSSRMNLAKEVDFTKLVIDAEGATGADIKAVCMEAGIFALREKKNQITKKNFEEALFKVLGEKLEMEDGINPEENRMYS
ncbi:MAG: proteasome-activating nucleotidase [archaeon]|nr:proteasome-activating nucleotidase [archaeon]